MGPCIRIRLRRCITVWVCSKACVYITLYRAHERIKDTGSEGPATGEGLGHVERGVGVILIILVQELHVVIVGWKDA